MSTIPPNEKAASTYVEQAAAADAVLDDQLAMLRDEEQAGEITTTEAAAERVAAMTAHLEKIRALRHEHFGGTT